MISIDGDDIPATPDDDPDTEELRARHLELKVCRAIDRISAIPLPPAAQDWPGNRYDRHASGTAALLKGPRSCTATSTRTTS